LSEILYIVSVVIPVYNSVKTIRHCLDSVRSQTIREIEIIVVDDSSEDGSTEILESVVLKDARIKVVHNKRTRGAGYARNTGMTNAKSEYLFFLDSDDFLACSSALERLVETAQKTHADVILCKHNRINRRNGLYLGMISTFEKSLWDKVEQGDVYREVRKLSDIPDLLLIPAYPWNKLYNRSFLIKNDIRCSETLCHNDIALSINSLIDAERIVFIPEILVIHSWSDYGEQLTNRTDSCRMDLFVALSDVDRFMATRNVSDIIRAYFLKFKWDAFNWGHTRINPKMSKRYDRAFGNSLKETPTPVYRHFMKRFVERLPERLRIRLLRHTPVLYSALRAIKLQCRLTQ
jgi:glycosyltransferase involved in cell wall biosynthesis